MSSQNPEIRFQVGAVSASVFVNEHQRADGSRFEVRNTVLQRTYRTDDGSYRTTTNFSVGDLPKAVLALSQAYAHCVMKPAAAANQND